MWFWLALIALLCWSGSDLFSKLGSKPDDRYSHLKMVIAVGVVMGIHAAIEIFAMGVNISLHDMLVYLPASLCYIFSMVLGYVGLRYIELSISSPICNSSGALVAIMCFLILGQTLNPIQTAAVVLIYIGMIFLGIVNLFEDNKAREARQETCEIKYKKSFIALLLPIFYCLLDAAGTFADGIILEKLDEDTANVAYELTFLAMGIVCFIILLIKNEKPSAKREAPKLAGAVFETAGQFAYIYALSANTIAAAPMICAYCAVSVLWSRIFLKEKLTIKHYLCIGAVIVGIVILGLFEEA